MSGAKSPLRLRSPQKHTSIDADFPTLQSPTTSSQKKFSFKKVAALGVVAVAAVAGVAYVSSNQASTNQHVSGGSHGKSFKGLGADCVADWGQCGGTNWAGATCCSVADSFCSAQSQWYSQCLPVGTNPFPAFTLEPTQAPPAPTTPGLVPDWGQCGGANYQGITSCSSATSTCSIQSNWYAQCLPAGTTPFPLVDYSFNQVVNGIVLNPRTVFNGVVNGATEVWGYEGKALAFDGNNDNVIVSNSEAWDFSSSGFTLAANVKRSTADSEDGIITKWYGPDNFLLKFQGNSLVFTVNFVTAQWQTITFDFADETYLGQWGFVKASYHRTGAGGSTMRLWWNGEQVGTLAVADNQIVHSDVPVHIGNTNNDWSYYGGVIDNVKIWNAAV